MQPFVKRLSVLCLACLLGGCLEKGGGGGSSKPTGETETPTDQTQPDVDKPLTPPALPVPPPLAKPGFPEPTSAVIDEVNALGFYDQDQNGQPRPVRNDLTGNLPAMLQFVQSHSVDPSGNEARNMPRLTSEREALLLVTPDPSLGKLQQLELEVSLDGKPLGKLAMRHPDQLYKADRSSTDARPDVVYSRRAWSAVLPWNWVQPGVTLRLHDEQGRSGQIDDSAIDFAPPGELVVQSIRLGLLTPPPQSGGHWFLTQPARAATDYFQTVPIARMVTSQYEDMYLPRVMVGSGKIYDVDIDGSSASNGGVYEGDMRENTAKSTFSTGINLANIGVTSAGMVSQENPHLTQSAVIHHARGVYINGVHNHGLSGGNGQLTLIDSVGNEFSHEIGHHYGLGHYPGQQGDNYFWAGHHHDSGWGYIAYRKRMRANLHWNRGKNDGMNGMPVYADAYSFGSDAMSGGHYASSLSRYTHYTGYSTKLRIQPAVDKAMVSASSPTGYRKWDASTRRMEVFAARVPNSSRVWYNSADGNYLAPRRFGVQVFTLLGGYDPVTGSAILYPPARGNWGHVFNLPAPVNQDTQKTCWVSVNFANGKNQNIAVAPNRMGSNANKLHINLAQDEQPLNAALSCQEAAGAAQELARVDFPQGLPAMAPATIVGKENGFNALRAAELPTLEEGLQAAVDQSFISLSDTTQLLLDSYADDLRGLSTAAAGVVQRYQKQQTLGLRLNRWMDAYKAQLDARDPDAEQALRDLLEHLQLNPQPLLPAAELFSMANGNCIKAQPGAESESVYIAAKAQCTKGADEQWMTDANGRIRSILDLSQCLTDQGSVTLTRCDNSKQNQRWDISALPRIKRADRCLDLSGGFLTNGRGKLITYGCSGGGNQQWANLSSNNNLLLPLVQARNMAVIAQLATSE